MKILLVAINAKYIHSNLAVYSLKYNAGQYIDNVELAEYTINNSKDHILESIYQKRADVVCFSCYIWNIEYVESIAKEFHKLSGDTPIWLGGPEVSYETQSFLQTHPYITGVMLGEGEDTFRELCQYYHNLFSKNNNTFENIDSLKRIDGLAYIDSKPQQITFTNPRKIKDLNDLFFFYKTMPDESFENRIIYYETSRGCPFSCSYCLSSIDKKVRFKDIEIVKEELLFFINKKVPQVKFVDRTFNCDHRHSVAIWKFIKENDNGITNFHFEIAADIVTQEEIDIIKDMRPGLIQLEIGVQSTNFDTIAEVHRKMDLERLSQNVQTIKSFGNIHQHLDLIAGLPFEGYESFANSYDEVFALKPDQLQLGFLKVLKGSYIFDHAEEYQIAYHNQPPYEVLKTKWLSYDEIISIKHVEEMTEVYYNSGQFEITMKLISKIENSMFAFLQKLGDYYSDNGYLSMNHSRLKRCEILLEFLKIKYEDKFDISLFENSLLFDLYYRENCKTRPDWAVDVSTLKEMNRQYCKDGKLTHIEPFDYNFESLETNSGKLPGKLSQPVWVIFDYRKRNPLNHQAECVYLNDI